MFTDMSVEGDFGLDLFWFDAAGAVGVVFVYEFDGDDGVRGGMGASFPDEGIGAGADCAGDDAEGEVGGEGLVLDLCGVG